MTCRDDHINMRWGTFSVNSRADQQIVKNDNEYYTHTSAKKRTENGKTMKTDHSYTNILN